MKPYVPDIVKSYEDTVSGYLRKSDTAEFLLHTVQCWCPCALDEDY